MAEPNLFVPYIPSRIQDIQNLQSELNGKAPFVHQHDRLIKDSLSLILDSANGRLVASGLLLVSNGVIVDGGSLQSQNGFSTREFLQYLDVNGDTRFQVTDGEFLIDGIPLNLNGDLNISGGTLNVDTILIGGEELGSSVFKNYDTPNGVAPLDSGGFVPLDKIPVSLLGGLRYQSTWNASTNTPVIPIATTSNKGAYYRVAVAGSTNISGITDWQVGDWLVCNGASWDKIDNSEIANDDINTTAQDPTDSNNVKSLRGVLSSLWASIALRADRVLGNLTNAATARTNLGLGNSSTRNVGSGAGDVAAGNYIPTQIKDGVTALRANNAQNKIDSDSVIVAPAFVQVDGYVTIDDTGLYARSIQGDSFSLNDEGISTGGTVSANGIYSNGDISVTGDILAQGAVNAPEVYATGDVFANSQKILSAAFKDYNAANGVAPLDGSSKVPLANLPDNVVSSLSDNRFPSNDAQLIHNNEHVTPNNSLIPKSFYHTDLNDFFWQANSRFYITATDSTGQNLYGDLFGSSAPGGFLISAESMKITIDITGKGEFPSGMEYYDGILYFTFYHTFQPSSIVVRTKTTNGVWVNQAAPTLVRQNGFSTLLSSPVGNAGGLLQSYEITIFKDPAQPLLWLSKLECRLTSFKGQQTSGIRRDHPLDSFLPVQVRDSGNNITARMHPNGDVSATRLIVGSSTPLTGVGTTAGTLAEGNHSHTQLKNGAWVATQNADGSFSFANGILLDFDSTNRRLYGVQQYQNNDSGLQHRFTNQVGSYLAGCIHQVDSSSPLNNVVLSRVYNALNFAPAFTTVGKSYGSGVMGTGLESPQAQMHVANTNSSQPTFIAQRIGTQADKDFEIWDKDGNRLGTLFVDGSALKFRDNVGAITSLSSLAVPASGGTADVAIGGTASASSTYNSGYLPLYAFDVDDNTRWSALGGTATLSYNRGDNNAALATAVKIYPHLESGGVNDAPRSFNIKARNNGGSWVTLLTVSNYTWSSTSPATFTFSNSTPYTEFQLDITAINGSNASIRKIQFLNVASGGVKGNVSPVDKLNLNSISSPIAASGVPTNLIRAIPFYDVNGEIIGYTPVYASIEAAQSAGSGSGSFGSGGSAGFGSGSGTAPCSASSLSSDTTSSNISHSGSLQQVQTQG